jgi:hypothetical protein
MLVTGDEAITPAKNPTDISSLYFRQGMKKHALVISIVCKSFAAAVAAERQMKTNMGTSTEGLRPYISDSGPKIMGPGMNPRHELSHDCNEIKNTQVPRIYSEIPRVAT